MKQQRLKKSRERLLLEKLMDMLFDSTDSTKIILETDYGCPYSLSIEKEGKGMHTHCTYGLDHNGSQSREEKIDLAIRSLCDHILDDRGLSWSVESGMAMPKGDGPWPSEE